VLEAADPAARIAHVQADGHGEMMGGLMALIGSIELDVLGEPTAEHAEMLSVVPDASTRNWRPNSWYGSQQLPTDGITAAGSA
jgi:hypothetical protein